MTTIVVSVFCLGCGDDLTGRSTDRRDLRNGDELVLKYWTDLFIERVAKSVVIDHSSESMILKKVLKNNRICRRCYSSFQRLCKLQDSISKNFDEAVEVLDLLTEVNSMHSSSSSSVGQKRCQESTTPVPTPKRRPSVRNISVS